MISSSDLSCYSCFFGSLIKYLWNSTDLNMEEKSMVMEPCGTDHVNGIVRKTSPCFSLAISQLLCMVTCSTQGSAVVNHNEVITRYIEYRCMLRDIH